MPKKEAVKFGLKHKAILIQAVLFGVFFFVSLPIAYVSLKRVAQKIEEYRADLNINRILNAIDYEQQILSAKAGDWAVWEDTVRFLESKDPSYIKANLNPVPFQEFSIHYMLFYDSKGRLFHAAGYDPKTKSPMPCSQKTKDTLQSLSVIQRILKANQDSLQGMALLGERLAFLSARAIRLPAETTAPPKGVLIMVRFLTPEFLKDLSRRIGLSIEIHPLRSGPNPTSNVAGIRAGPRRNPTVWKDKETLLAYRTLTDIDGQPMATLSAEIPTITQRIQTTALWIVGLGLILLASMLSIAGYILIDRVFLGRLVRLAKQLVSIGDSEDFNARVEAGGNDEIGMLAQSINRMLEGLSSARQLERAYQYAQGVLESANVGILVIDPEGNIHRANNRIAEMTGYSKADLLSSGLSWERLFEPSSLLKLKECVSQTLKDLKPARVESWILCKDGRQEAALVSIAPLFSQRHQGNRRLVVGITDITQIKRLQEELRTLSFFDALTGVYNRNYFEQELKRLCKGRQTVGLIIADVDFLKPINDTLGHLEGDKLLKKAAKILQETFRADDIVARIGGDEFAVILPGIDETLLDKILSRLKAAIQEANLDDGRIPLSLSVGKAISHGAPFDPHELIKEADRNMYQNKTQRRQEVIERIKRAGLTPERN